MPDLKAALRTRISARPPDSPRTMADTLLDMIERYDALSPRDRARQDSVDRMNLNIAASATKNPKASPHIRGIKGPLDA